MKYLIFLSFIILLTVASFGQQGSIQGRFGGPFATIAFNQHGPALSFGGGGTFLVKNGYYIGIYGQGMTSLIARSAKIDKFVGWKLKAKFTGFWVGYFDELEKYSNLHLVYYAKVGLGSVFLENQSSSIRHYDNAIAITPHIEPIIKITSFLKIGIGIFYEFYAGVNLKSYTNKDFNAFGGNISFRFTSSH